MDNNSTILDTLIYSDIFNYPLTADEMWYYLHTDCLVSKTTFTNLLKKHKDFATDGKYFFLQEREKIVSQREKLCAINQKKMQYVQKIARLLTLIPTLECIGVSGSVAMLSAKENDDVDLFFITKPRTLWFSRLLVLCFLRVFGVARKRGDKKTKNKICANMFLDRSALLFSPARQNLYTAHEIAQLKVLFDKNSCYQAFLQANRWIHIFLYNVPIVKEKRAYKYHNNLFLKLLEYIAEKIQRWYMKKYQTHEEITKQLLAFHPLPYDACIQEEYDKKKKAYGL